MSTLISLRNPMISIFGYDSMQYYLRAIPQVV